MSRYAAGRLNDKRVDRAVKRAAPKRFIVAFDGYDVYLRRTLNVTHDASAGEVRYDTQPLRWTARRRDRVLAVLTRLMNIEKIKDDACIACGMPLLLHYTAKKRWKGCPYARRRA